MLAFRFTALVFLLSCADAEIVKMKIVDHISNYGYNNFGAHSSSTLVAKVQPSNFSGPVHLKSLVGKCYTLTINDYKYKLCPFNNATQHEQTFRWNPYSGILGIWREWKVMNNTFHSMIMGNGESCGTTDRQVEVVMLCGVANNLTTVTEPKTCHYRMTFETPLVCHEDSMLVYPRLNETLRNEWDEIERQYHDEEITQKGYNLHLQKLFWKAGLVKDPPNFYKDDSFQEYKSLETCNAEYQKLLDEKKARTNRVMGKSSLEIFFFIPNIIGYFRLLLILVSWIYIEESSIFLPLYILNVILDEVDGRTARKFNQVSSYGAWLDVVLDLIGRGMVWCFSYKYGYAIVAFEWIVFLGNTERANGKQWKESFDQAPKFVHWVMENGYKKPLGILAIIGLHFLPIWIYIIKMKVVESITFATFLVALFLIVARVVCGAVELWCMWKYIELLLHRSPHKSVVDK